jgi:photosystem II stability/assembly factor-like uncharacterized protein
MKMGASGRRSCAPRASGGPPARMHASWQRVATTLLVVLVAACTARTPSPTVPPLSRSAPPSERASAPPLALPSPVTSPPVATSTSFQPDALAFGDPQHGLLGGGFRGQDGSGPGIVMGTSDGGSYWSTLATLAAPVRQVWVVGEMAWALTACDASIPACAPQLLRSTDGGTTWAAVPTSLGWLSFVDARDGWGAAPDTATMSTALERTSDGGVSWAPTTSPCQGSPAGPLRAVAFRSASSGLAVCATTLGAGGEFHSVLATSDGGATWRVRASVAAPPAPRLGSLPYGGYIRGLALAPDGTAWLWGDRMAPLAGSADGATWQPLGIGAPDALPVNAVWPLDARQGFALLWDPNRQATLVEATADGGRTWQVRAAFPVDTRAPTGSPSGVIELPAGSALVDTSFSFGALAWSPGGQVLAAEAADQGFGHDRVDLFAPDGARIASIPGSGFGWLDAARLAVYQASPSVGGGTIGLYTTAGRLIERLPGRWGGMLANGHGSLALEPVASPGLAAAGAVRIWTAGTLGPPIAGEGMPERWSPDGTRLLLVRTDLTAQTGATLASTGGPIPGVLTVIRAAVGAVIAPTPYRLADVRGSRAWSPDGRYLATDDAGGATVLDLASGRVLRTGVTGSPLTWRPDGRLVLVASDGASRLWSPNGQATPSGLPPGDPTYGPTLAQVAIRPPSGATMLTLISHGTTLALSADPGSSATWAPDGSACFVTTAAPGTPMLLVRVASP